MSIAADVEKLIVTEIAGGRGIESLAYDQDLLTEAIIDSLGIVELITFLEAEYKIKVEDDDVDAENFRSIDSIVSLVESKRG